MNSLAHIWRTAAARIKHPFGRRHAQSAAGVQAPAGGTQQRPSNVIRLEQVRDELAAANEAETARVASLERRLADLQAHHHSTAEQVRDLERVLNATRSELENTSDQVRWLEQQVEEGRQLYLNSVQETHMLFRRQDLRLNWLMLVSGLALLLAVVAGAILVWDVQKNAGLLAGMSADIKQLMSDMERRGALLAPGVTRPSRGAAATRPPGVAPQNGSPAATNPPLPLPPVAEPKASSRGDSAAAGLAGSLAAVAAGEQGGMQDFFARNAAMPGVVSLPSGVQYRVVRPGKGRAPGIKDWVVVDYLGMTPDGSIFDNTYDSGQRAIFGMEGLSPGWREPLLKMREGAEFEIYLPPEIANIGGIPSPGKPEHEPGIYLIELLHVVEVGAAD